MKKLLTTLSIIFLIASNLIAQKDSNIYRRAIILKINPGEILMNNIAVGEYGGSIQYNVTDTIAIFLGGGYNIAALATTVVSPQTNLSGYSLNPYTGFTIRGGTYIFLKKHRFVSIQLFFRSWKKSTDFSFEDGKDSFDYIESPLQAADDGGDDTPFNIGAVSATITDFSVLYGGQVIGKQTHFFLEWFVGLGLRLKNINTEELGYVNSNGQYDPFQSPKFSSYQSAFPDLRLGFQVGYKL